jgi:histidine ammonia-lyase
MLKRTADGAPGGTAIGAAATGASLDGHGLDVGTVARIADGALPPGVRPAALEAMERARRAARRLAAEGARVAAAAIAEIQACATPAALGHVVLSHGLEEAASFATQAARKALRLTEAYRLVLGCELVAAVRALRQRGAAPAPATPAGRAYARAAAVLDPAMEDRPLTDDVTDAAALLDEFAELATEC